MSRDDERIPESRKPDADDDRTRKPEPQPEPEPEPERSGRQDEPLVRQTGPTSDDHITASRYDPDAGGPERSDQVVEGERVTAERDGASDDAASSSDGGAAADAGSAGDGGTVADGGATSEGSGLGDHLVVDGEDLTVESGGITKAFDPDALDVDVLVDHGFTLSRHGTQSVDDAGELGGTADDGAGSAEDATGGGPTTWSHAHLVQAVPDEHSLDHALLQVYGGGAAPPPVAGGDGGSEETEAVVDHQPVGDTTSALDSTLAAPATGIDLFGDTGDDEVEDDVGDVEIVE